MRTKFEKRLQSLESSYKELVRRTNKKLESANGIYNRYIHPVLTAGHIPVFWRYDLNYETNPYLMERYAIHAVHNAGAVIVNGKYLLLAIIQGTDKKTVITVAESSNGIDNFEIWDYPVAIPSLPESGLNICDMQLVQHEDGWIYWIFSTERAGSENAPATLLQCSIARTTDLKSWEHLSDLKTPSLAPRQKVILHSQFVEGKYAFYIIPDQAEGTVNGIGFVLSDSVSDAIIDIKTKSGENHPQTNLELKTIMSSSPVKTQYGWLHLVNGKRNITGSTENGIYAIMTDLKNPARIIYQPAGYLLTPEGDEKTEDAVNPVSCNGWVAAEDGTVYIYYACSGTQLHVATTTVDQLLDYVMNTASEGISHNTLFRIIDNNKAQMQLKPSLKEKG